MKLSLLITYHNEGEWLTDSLRSVLAQLHAGDEVLIHDDASTKPAQQFVVPDPRIRVRRTELNIGPARARNALIAASSGTHLHFHDADDLFAPVWRERIAAAFTPGIDVVFSDVSSFDHDGNRTPGVMQIGQLQSDADLLKFALLGSVLVPAGTYTRELVERVGGYRADLWQSEDYDFHIRMALLEPRWSVVPEDLVLIRRHSRQRSRVTGEVWLGALQSLEALVDTVPKHARAHAAQAATRAGSALFSIGAVSDAKRAFALADRFGGARYPRQGMQRLSSAIGAASAERLAALYRAIVPTSFRMRLQKKRGT